MKKLFAAAAIAACASAFAWGPVSFLVAQWVQNGQQMCKYDNGTILNIGVGVCPMQIGG